MHTFRLYLYIDPSTGSMLFAVIIGMVSALFFGFKTFMMKIKSRLGVNIKDIGMFLNLYVMSSKKEE